MEQKRREESPPSTTLPAFAFVSSSTRRVGGRLLCVGGRHLVAPPPRLRFRVQPVLRTEVRTSVQSMTPSPLRSARSTPGSVPASSATATDCRGPTPRLVAWTIRPVDTASPTPVKGSGWACSDMMQPAGPVALLEEVALDHREVRRVLHPVPGDIRTQRALLRQALGAVCHRQAPAGGQDGKVHDVHQTILRDGRRLQVAGTEHRRHRRAAAAQVHRRQRSQRMAFHWLAPTG